MRVLSHSSSSRVAAPAPTFSAQRLLVLILLLTLAGAAADQAAVAVLFSTSPLFALFACLLLVLRRESPAEPASINTFSLAGSRVILFCAAHCTLIGCFLIAGRSWGASSGNLSISGW